MKPSNKVIPVSQKQIDAANSLHDRIEQFGITDRALQRLRNKLPGWDDEASAIKCIALNAIYSTRVLNIETMARHVSRILGDAAFSSSSENELVEKIASLPAKHGNRHRRHLSFASKLCHRFVDEHRFPIYDTVARKMLKFHLGSNYCKDALHPYSAFLKNLQQLRSLSDFSATGRALDHYLWIAGLYMTFKKTRHKSDLKINTEVLRIFTRPTSVERNYLDILLPS
jgi:hypothetical protein